MNFGNEGAGEDLMKNLVRTKIEEQQRRNRIPWDEAVQQTRHELAGLGNIDLLLESIEAERPVDLIIDTDNQDIIDDHQAKPWYEGPNTEDATVWRQLRDAMSNGGLKAALPTVDEHSTQIVGRLAAPFVEGDRRRGLVIGYVQSGKTANYASVIAKAVDAEYRMIIVLAGIHSNLRAQTQTRLERDLNVHDGRWIQLTGPHSDIGPQQSARGLVNGDQRILAVVKKQKQRLQNLERMLRDIPEQERRDYPILIIDDESDQATPDSAAADDEMTQIHRQLRSIWGLVRNGSYVSYTATPFANLFMEPDDEDSLYPRNFIHVLPEPDGYFGARRIFGIGSGAGDADGEDGELDVVRSIPDADREEVVPPSRRRGKDDEGFLPGVPPSLREAVAWFVLATAIRRQRGQAEKHSSMLVHTTHRAEPHVQHAEAIDSYLEELRRSVLIDEDYGMFQDLYVREVPRAAEIRSLEHSQAPFSEVRPFIVDVLSDVKVFVDNGKESAEQRVYYRDDRPTTAIVVGGNTLSRGLTLEGLFVSYFARRSLAYDSLLQMGRWFGFRPGYADLMRLWLSEGLAGDYQFLAQVENQVREDIRLMWENNQTPAEVGIRVLGHPGRLSITGKGKMKHAQRLRVGFEGRRVETNIFDISPDRLQENLDATSRFVDSLESSGLESLVGSQGSRLYRGVPYRRIEGFLREYAPHEAHRLLTEDGAAFNWFDEWDRKVKDGAVPRVGRENLWNVVLISGGRDQSWDAGPVSVSTVNRAPLQQGKKPSSIAGDDQAVGIRALMSSQDHLTDLRILQDCGVEGFDEIPKRADEAEAGKLRRQFVQGRGLLVLYVIDKDSEPRSNQSKARELLQAPDHVVGLGLISPSNPISTSLDQEVYIGVEPGYFVGDDVEEDDEAIDAAFPEDDEGDHLASGSS